MAEKIIYEVALEGVTNVVNNLGRLENSISNVKFGAIRALNKELEHTETLTKTIAHLAPSAMKSYNKSMHFEMMRRRWMMVTARWQASNIRPDITKNFKESWNKNSSDFAELRRLANRQSGDWGTMKQRMPHITREMYGRPQLLLPYISGEGFDYAYDTDDNESTLAQFRKENKERIRRLKEQFAFHKRAEEVLAETQRKREEEKNRPQLLLPYYKPGEYWSSPVQQDTNNGEPKAFKKRFSELIVTLVSKALKAIGVPSEMIAKVGEFLSKILVFGLLKKALSMLARSIRAMADTSWKLLRESLYFGIPSSSLAQQWNALGRIGGNREDASRLFGSMAYDIASLGYGGTGGNVMEAARLFGLKIIGSGNYGYATPKELMGNVVDTMSRLDQPGRMMLAKTLGLNDYQYYAVTGGRGRYDTLMNQRTLLGEVMGTDALYSDTAMNESKFFLGAITQLKESLLELLGVIGEALLPILTILSDLLSGIIQVMSLVLKPIGAVLNSIFKWLNQRWWEENDEIDSSVSTGFGDSYSTTSNASTVNVSIGEISLNSLGLKPNASQEEIRDAVQNAIFDKIGEQLTNDRR